MAPRPEHWSRVGTLPEVLDAAADEVFECNKAHGWYEEDRTFGDDVALLHSEVSELLEAHRNSTGHRAEELEAADILIRLLDTCVRHNYNLGAAFRMKMDINWRRDHRHGGKVL